MTGYGRAECLTGKNRIIVEIRSVNGKNSDINFKSSVIPRDKETELRQLIIKYLQRGTIDLFLTIESQGEEKGKKINKELFVSYYNQIRDINQLLEEKLDYTGLINTILRLPEVVDNQKEDPGDNWESVKSCIEKALSMLCDFRTTEGKRLAEDILMRVKLITNCITDLEKYEVQRVEAIKDRLYSRIHELSCSPDINRLEQEIIYYVEKLDITEEKVRLGQHCKYFLECMENEQFPGKKLGFIAQEMGREINTIGSKANHAEIQKIVVMMKDELEKIKEQILNIL
jgi:uncharacterized protein (TIGR00255 family)